MKALRNTLVAALVLGVLGLAAGPSQAYSWIRVANGNDVKWDLSATRPNQASGRIKYRIGTAGTSDSANFAAGAGSEFDAIQRSFNVWRNLYGSAVDFEFDGNVAAPSQNLNDDVNTVYWTNTELPAGVYAVTTSAFDNTTGQLLDADLVFNDRDFSWDVMPATMTVGVPGRAYIQQIAVHEIGHFLGIDHSFVSNASMFPFTESGAINFLSLETDDTAPILTAYPDPHALLPATGSVSGVVSTSDGTGRPGVHVALVNVSNRRVVVAALTNPANGTFAAGSFRIDRVPPGNYWMIATQVFTSELGSYYSQSFTNLMPCVLGTSPGVAGNPTLLRVVAGSNVTGADLTVGNVTNAHEPNNTTAQATPLLVGQAVGSRIGTGGDVDFFAVPLVQGQATVIHVHSDAVGQELNPELELRGPDGTTVIATGEFGAPGFAQNARDIDASFFGTNGVDYDCFIEHTAATSGTFFVRVRGTSNTTGAYIISAVSTATFSGTDPGATRITAATPGVLEGGASVQVSVEPRDARSILLPLTVSRTVQLLDAANGDAVIDSKTGAGPWDFSVSMGATAGVRRFAATVDGVRMLRELEIPVAGTLDPGMSSVRVVNGSLVADGADTSLVEVILRDAAGRIRVDPSVAVQVTASAGTLTNTSGGTGPSIPAIRDAATGAWHVTLRAPAAGTSLTVSATAGSVAVGSHVVALTAKASGTGGGTPAGGGGGGGGGCSLGQSRGSSGSSGLPFAWLVMLAGMVLGGWVVRREAGSVRRENHGVVFRIGANRFLPSRRADRNDTCLSRGHAAPPSDSSTGA